MTSHFIDTAKGNSQVLPTLDKGWEEDALATFDLNLTNDTLRVSNDVAGDPLIQTATVREFTLNSGRVLPEVSLGYTVYASNLRAGEVPADREVILIHPALTGTARFKLGGPTGSQGDGWGSGWAGSGNNPETKLPYFLDTDKYTVIGIDHLGGRAITDGSDGPGSTSARALGDTARELILQDGVHLASRILSEQFDLTGVKAVIGGSMGGGQAFEWLFQDRLAVGTILDISGCGTLDANAREYFEIHARFLHDDEPVAGRVESLMSRISDDLHESRRTEGLEQAVQHVVNRFKQFDRGVLADSQSREASKLFIARQLGFLLFVTPEFFEDKREVGLQAEGMISVASWLDHQGTRFARRFDSPGLGTLCDMVARSNSQTASSVADRLEALGTTNLIRTANFGDTLFPAEQQLTFNSELRHRLGGKGRFTEFFSSDKRNGHDRFFTKDFLRDDAEFLRLKLEGVL